MKTRRQILEFLKENPNFARTLTAIRTKEQMDLDLQYLDALMRLAWAARDVVRSPKWNGVCHEDVELERAVITLIELGVISDAPGMY